MKTMIKRASVVVTVFRIPKNIHTPTENSSADKRMAANIGKKDGSQEVIPKASR